MTLSQSDRDRVESAFQKVSSHLSELANIISNRTSKENVKARSPKKIKDPNEPKRNLSSYMLYYQSARLDVTAENPDIKSVDIARLVGKKWNRLSEKEKQPFVKLAAKDKARFDKEIDAYKTKMANHKRRAEEEGESKVPTKRKAERKKTK